MEKAFAAAFAEVRKDLRKNLEADEKHVLPDASKPVSLQGSGSIPFKFHLDNNGNYHLSISQYGAGVTIHATAWINSPDAVYSITVKSSDGGGGHWDNVHPGQKLLCDLHTSFWHSTTITVDLNASVANKDGDGTIDYTY